MVRAQTSPQAAAVAWGQFTCDRCKRDEKPVKSFSAANDIDSGVVPNPFTGLTQAKEMLIAKGCPVMRVYRLKGGQRENGGHVVNLAQNVGGFINRLPRVSRDLPIVVVRRRGGEGTHKYIGAPAEGLRGPELGPGKHCFYNRIRIDTNTY